MPPDAEITRNVLDFCGTVEMLKFACVAPSATVTVAGTVATKTLLLLRFTTVPPAGAGAGRITVPVEGGGPPPNSGLITSDVCGFGPLNGGKPPGKGRYNGSPIFKIIHLIHASFLRKASPKLATSRRFQKTPSGCASPCK